MNKENNTKKEIWHEILLKIKETIFAPSFDLFFRPIKLTDIDINKEDKILTLQIDGINTIEVMEKRFIPILKNSIEEVLKEKYEINFVCKSKKIIEEKIDKKEEIKEIKEKNLLKNNLDSTFSDENYFNPRYSFKSFVVAPTNELAHAASVAVAENPSCISSNNSSYNPLFLYGDSGLGKTHLMHAIGQHISINYPHLKVLYVSSEMFTNELIKAINEQKTLQFKNKYRQIDVLLIDDIQFLEGKDRTIEEFFHTFNTLYEINKQIIISSDRPPSKLLKIDERLRSRFQWNMMADIKAPDYETRVAILIKKVEDEGLEIDEDLKEVIFFIADKIKHNIRELEGALTRVLAFSNMFKKHIDLKFTKNVVLKDILSNTENNITPNIIKKEVCNKYKIKIQDIESKKRTRNLAFPRQIAMYLCREMTELSFPAIGTHFGNRDHTTVLHAYEKISSEININEELSKDIASIKSQIEEKS